MQLRATLSSEYHVLKSAGSQEDLRDYWTFKCRRRAAIEQPATTAAAEALSTVSDAVPVH